MPPRKLTECHICHEKTFDNEMLNCSVCGATTTTFPDNLPVRLRRINICRLLYHAKKLKVPSEQAITEAAQTLFPFASDNTLASYVTAVQRLLPKEPQEKENKPLLETEKMPGAKKKQ